MAGNHTPEEKLLNLIRKKKKPINTAVLVLERVGAVLKKLIGECFGYLWNKLLLVKEKIAVSKRFNRPAVFYINKILIVLNIALGVFAIRQVYSLASLKGINYGSLEQNKPLEHVTNDKKGMSLSYYMRNIRGGVFKPLESEVPKTASSQGRSVKVVLADLIKNMSVSGIVADGKRVQAIIVDSVKNETYFVYKGDKINDISIEKILENRVIVSYEDEQSEIVMH